MEGITRQVTRNGARDMAAIVDDKASEYDAELSRREKTWDGFLESQSGTGFMQSSWWANFKVTSGWGHFGVVLRDGETIMGGAQVMTYVFAPGNCFYYIPEGPVLPEDESDSAQVFQRVFEFIEAKRKHEEHVVSHLRIEPRWEHLPSFVGGFRQSRGWMEPRNTLYIDLNPSERAILAQMKPKGRYNISVARRHDVSIVEDVSPQGIEDFLSIYQETVTRHDLPGTDQEFFYTLIPRLSALEHGSVFFAEYQGVRVATALVVYFGLRATYFFGGSRAIHRDVMAPYLMHYEIMRKAKDLGCQWYDMYGIAPQTESNHPWSSISVFKRKLGGKDFSFVPTMDYIYDPIAYETYREGHRQTSRSH
jgi:lipid II:glycine glycyltransferase (peptidoglycan interpeptide bridge formation enzyme)